MISFANFPAFTPTGKPKIYSVPSIHKLEQPQVGNRPIEIWASPKFARWKAMIANRNNFMLLGFGMFNCNMFDEKKNFYTLVGTSSCEDLIRGIQNWIDF